MSSALTPLPSLTPLPKLPSLYPARRVGKSLTVCPSNGVSTMIIGPVLSKLMVANWKVAEPLRFVTRPSGVYHPSANVESSDAISEKAFSLSLPGVNITSCPSTRTPVRSSTANEPLLTLKLTEIDSLSGYLPARPSTVSWSSCLSGDSPSTSVTVRSVMSLNRLMLLT